jgi:hypothetical protein
MSSSLAVIYFISIVPDDKGESDGYINPLDGNSICSVGNFNFCSITFLLFYIYKYIRKKEAIQKDGLILKYVLD